MSKADTLNAGILYWVPVQVPGTLFLIHLLANVPEKATEDGLSI